MEGRLPQAAEATSSSASHPENGESDDCPLCGGIGWVRRNLPVEDPEFGKLLPCQCSQERFEAERFERLLKFSNLGGLASVTFEGLAAQTHRGEDGSQERFRRALEASSAFAEKPEGWLVVVGPGASGKTQLAAAIANHCMQRGQRVFFIAVADLLDHLRAAYAPSSETPYDELFDQVRNVPVLVLDDLGYQSSTPWAQEKLSQLLGHRHNDRAPTVITTDVPLEAMDDRLRARLSDASLVQVVEMGGALTTGGHSIDSLDLEALSHMTFEGFDAGGLNLRGPMRENLVEAKNLAMSFAEHPDGWLVFVGGYGCGKTHLAASIAHRRRSLGDDALFVFVPDLLDYLRSTFQPDSGSTYEVLDRVKRVGLLILDDFSEPIDTPWAREKLYQILNYRYLTRLPTVITSGVEPRQLEPRIWSRMDDPRLSNVYEIMAPDYRTGRRYAPKASADGERPRGRPRGRGTTV